MTILALEFSSVQRSVAVMRALPGTVASAVSVVETGTRGTMAFEMIQAALRDANLEREQIDVLAVGLGPGSYTGIRVALAIAQGWQLASPENRLKLLGVSSAECLAAQAQAGGIRGRVNVVIDAQREEFYLAAYDLSAAGWKEIEPLRILSRREIESRAIGILIGPEMTRWFPESRSVFPRAATLGQLASARSDFAPANELAPIYLRETHYAKPVRPKAML